MDQKNKDKLTSRRRRMLEWSGVMPFRYGFYNFAYGMALASIVLVMFALFTGAHNILWMIAGGWAVALAQLIFMVIYDPLEPEAREGKRKMYCVVSREALDKMTVKKEGKPDQFLRGKFAAQCGHAYLHAWWDAFVRFNGEAIAYRSSQHAFKIAVVVDGEAQLVALHDAYRDKCGTSLVTDAGFTVFSEPTMTCLGIGPILEDEVGDDLKGLKLLR